MRWHPGHQQNKKNKNNVYIYVYKLNFLTFKKIMFLYYYGIMYLLCLCVLVGCIFCYVLPNQNNTTAVRFRIIGIHNEKKLYFKNVYIFCFIVYC